MTSPKFLIFLDNQNASLYSSFLAVKFHIAIK